MARQAETEGGNSGEMAEVVREAAARLSKDLSRTARAAQEAADEFASRVKYSAGELGERASELGDRTIRQLRRAERSVEESVREHPITWVATAAGVGAFIGLLLARRR